MDAAEGRVLAGAQPALSACPARAPLRAVLTTRAALLAEPLEGAAAETAPLPEAPSCGAAVSHELAGPAEAAVGLEDATVLVWPLAAGGKPSRSAPLPAAPAAVLPLPFAAAAGRAAFCAVLPSGALWTVAGAVAAEAAPAPAGGRSRVVWAAAETRPNFSVAVVLRRGEGKAAPLEVDVYRVRAAPRGSPAGAAPVATRLGSHALPAAAGRAEAPCAAAFDLGCRTLALLFPDGEWQAYRFSQTATRANALALAPELAVRRAMDLDAGAAAASSLAFVAPSVVAVASPRGFSYWETLYGTVLGRHAVPAAAAAAAAAAPKKAKKSKKSKKAAAGWAAAASRAGLAAGGAALVAVLAAAGGEGAAAVEVPLPAVPAPTLAGAMGRMGSTLPFVAEAERDALVEAPLQAAVGPPATVASAEPSEADSTREERERELLAALDKAKTAATYVKRFEAYAEAVRRETEAARPARRRRRRRKRQREAEAAEQEAAAAAAAAGSEDEDEDEEEQEDEEEARRAKRARYSASFSQPLMTRVARRCLTDGAKAMRAPLELLLRSNKFSGRYVPELVERLIELRWLDLLELCLVHVHDLPEGDMVRVVRFALAEVARGGAGASGARKVDEADHEAEVFLHLALSCPRSDVLLQGALGGLLSTAEVLQLLRYLHKWLARYWQRSEADLRRECAGQRLPSLSQVVDWASMLLDEHLASLLQLPEAHQWVREAQYLVTAQHVALCERMEGLKGVLQHLRTRKGLPREAPTDYSVETLWPFGAPPAAAAALPTASDDAAAAAAASGKDKKSASMSPAARRVKRARRRKA